MSRTQARVRAGIVALVVGAITVPGATARSADQPVRSRVLHGTATRAAAVPARVESLGVRPARTARIGPSLGPSTSASPSAATPPANGERGGHGWLEVAFGACVAGLILLLVSRVTRAVRPRHVRL